jgi:ribosomal protein L29
LRRVHTDTGAQDGEITEEEEDAKTGQKRKRSTALRGVSTGDLHEEMKRLKAENEELRRQSQIHNAQVGEMMRQIQDVGVPESIYRSISSNQTAVASTSTSKSASEHSYATSQHALNAL